MSFSGVPASQLPLPIKRCYSRSVRVGWIPALLAAVLLSAMLSWTPAQAADTPSLGGGDCWRPNIPLTCTWNWPGRNRLVTFKFIDQFSWMRPTWWYGINEAKNRWNTGYGPQSMSWNDQTNNVWIYHIATDWGDGTFYARTFQCNTSYVCNMANVPWRIYYSQIWYSWPDIDGLPGYTFDYISTHETGHAMGLVHNASAEASVMQENQSGSYVSSYPTPADGGHWPGCSGSNRGLACIYGWHT